MIFNPCFHVFLRGCPTSLSHTIPRQHAASCRRWLLVGTIGKASDAFLPCTCHANYVGFGSAKKRLKRLLSRSLFRWCANQTPIVGVLSTKRCLTDHNPDSKHTLALRWPYDVHSVGLTAWTNAGPTTFWPPGIRWPTVGIAT